MTASGTSRPVLAMTRRALATSCGPEGVGDDGVDAHRNERARDGVTIFGNGDVDAAAGHGASDEAAE